MAWNPTSNSASGGPTTLAQAGDLLVKGQLTEALSAFQAAAMRTPDAPAPLLGIAQVELAMGHAEQVRASTDRLQALAPDSPVASLAQAIALTATGDHAGALAADDTYIARATEQREAPIPYAFALRGYLLRRLGQRYDGELAKARAARAWGTRDFDHLFPRDAVPTTPAAAPLATEGGPNVPNAGLQPAPRPWDQRSQLQRRTVQMRFMTRGVPIATFSLIAINVVIYLVGSALGGSFTSPNSGYYVNTVTQVFAGAPNPLYNIGMEQGLLIAHQPWQVYRIVSAMFLHASIVHIGLNMLSLYFVGVITEQFFGTRRWLIIYFASGIIAGAAQAIIAPTSVSLGASGAIFGIFGAFGAFAFLNRQAFGRAGNSILMQWAFWLVVNFVFDIQSPGIALWAHVGGLIAGILIGYIMLQRQARPLARR